MDIGLRCAGGATVAANSGEADAAACRLWTRGCRCIDRTQVFLRLASTDRDIEVRRLNSPPQAPPPHYFCQPITAGGQGWFSVLFRDSLSQPARLFHLFFFLGGGGFTLPSAQFSSLQPSQFVTQEETLWRCDSNWSLGGRTTPWGVVREPPVPQHQASFLTDGSLCLSVSLPVSLLPRYLSSVWKLSYGFLLSRWQRAKEQPVAVLSLAAVVGVESLGNLLIVRLRLRDPTWQTGLFLQGVPLNYLAPFNCISNPRDFPPLLPLSRKPGQAPLSILNLLANPWS